MSVGVNPLAVLTDDELWNLQVLLALACGRAKTVLRKSHRAQFCSLLQVMRSESDLRGKPIPSSPPYVSQLKRYAL